MSLTLAIVLAGAAGFADLDAIDREVAQFTGITIGQPGGATSRVDRRLRLNSCATELAITWNTQRRDTVVVRCPDAGGWRLFVPVVAVAPAPVAAAMPAVNRGDAVTIAVQGDGFSVSQPGEALEGGPVGAWIRVRSLKPGAARTPSDAMRARIVRPGVVALPLD